MRVLVTVDGSPLSEAILRHLDWLRAVPGAEIILFRVVEDRGVRGVAKGEVPTDATAGPVAVSGQWDPSGGSLPNTTVGAGVRHGESWEQALERQVDEAQGYLRHLAANIKGVPVRTEVEAASDVGRAIVERAKREKAILIAMATHGRTGLSRVVAGSVAEAVVHQSEVPVLVLRPGRPAEHPQRAADTQTHSQPDTRGGLRA